MCPYREHKRDPPRPLGAFVCALELPGSSVICDSRLFALSGLASERACRRSGLSTEAPLHNVLFWSCFSFLPIGAFWWEVVCRSLVDRNGGWLAESEGVIGLVVPAGWRWIRSSRWC